MTYWKPDPLDPPMVEVLVDGRWWPGFVRAQEQRDGDWWITVEFRREGRNYLEGFPADRVRPDETDYSRGPRVTFAGRATGSVDHDPWQASVLGVVLEGFSG